MSTDPSRAGGQEGHLPMLARILTAGSGSPEGSAQRQQALDALLSAPAASGPAAGGPRSPGQPAAEPGPGTASGALDAFAGHVRAELRRTGMARKVSVSMPADLMAAVQERAGRGRFSQYVSEAVARQLEADLLGDLSGLLAAEHGPVPGEYLAQALAAWPDGD
jgi:hypothetical protein